jgi:ABC-type Fe3+-siderophore transport system permease subunit
MSVTDWLKLFTMCQGAFVFGITIFIFLYYFKSKKIVPYRVKLHVLFVSFGFLLVLGCTMITVFRQVYHYEDFWYWLLGLGYLITDIGLITLFIAKLKDHYK